MNRHRASILLSLSFTAFFLWLALRGVHFSDLGDVLSTARWGWIPLMICATLSDLMIRGLRWKILLSRVARAPFGLFFRLETIGLAVNNVLFMRIGEFARAGLVSRELNIPLVTALASVAVERAFDLTALVGLFCAASFLAPELVGEPVRHMALVVFASGIAALFILTLAEKALAPGGVLDRRLKSFPKLHRLISELVLGAAVLRKPSAALRVVGLSVALWLADASLFWLGAKALGLEWAITFPRAILALSWAGAGAALPAVPGAIGTFEAMVKTIVESMGVSPEQAFVFAFFVHMVTYIFVTVLGLFSLYKVGLSLGGLKSALKKAPAKEAKA